MTCQRIFRNNSTLDDQHNTLLTNMQHPKMSSRTSSLCFKKQMMCSRDYMDARPALHAYINCWHLQSRHFISVACNEHMVDQRCRPPIAPLMLHALHLSSHLLDKHPGLRSIICPTLRHRPRSHQCHGLHKLVPFALQHETPPQMPYAKPPVHPSNKSRPVAGTTARKMAASPVWRLGFENACCCFG